MKVLVVGAGTMGHGIAQVCAQAGHAVTLQDVESDQLDRALDSIRRSVERLYDKGRLAEHPPTILDRIRAVRGDAPAPDLRPDLAVEAVPEDEQLKVEVLRSIERACHDHALVATNTSGIPVSVLAHALERPARFGGLHFFNPVPLMRVVEVVAGDATSDDTLDALTDFARGLDKDPLVVRRDVPGFVLNRIAMAASNEAIRLVEDGVATASEVDAGVKGAFGWKMGPLETADLVGLDVVLAARRQIFEQTSDPRFEPPSLLRELVRRGHLGRKTGRGFHEYGS